MFVSKFWYLDRFLRYLRSKSKVVQNQVKFSTFWPYVISGVHPSTQKNLCISDHAHPMARHVAKFHRGTPFTSKTAGMDMSDFKPIFNLSLKKYCEGTPIPSGRCASKTWSFSSACKNLVAQHPLGAKTWSFEKNTLGGYSSTLRSLRLLDQSSPDLFRLTLEELR